MRIKWRKRKVLAFLAIITIVALASVCIVALLERHGDATRSARSYDVVVVGAGPGGIAASIQAAKMGEKVALLEETDWVGGQMTAAGVGTMDEDSLTVRNSGIYKNFVSRVSSFYAAHGKSMSTCYFGPQHLCVDPSVGQEILRQMLNNAGRNLEVYTATKVISVRKKGNTVTGVMTNNKGMFNSKVVIDASEYGDVLSMAGAPFRLGTGTNDTSVDKSCTQSLSYTAIIKYYPQGVPAGLTFSHAPPGYNEAIKAQFAKYLTTNGYDYASDHKQPYSFQSYTAYRGLPDLTNPQNYDAFQQNGHTITRTALILGNDFPIGTELSSKHVSDPTLRIADTCQAKMLTLQLIYYIQHDLGQKNWSIANDEGYDTKYNIENHCQLMNGFEAFEYQMPQEPYVREARRVIGVETLTSASLLRPWTNENQMPTADDSIAVGYYPMDLHGCSASQDLEETLDSIIALNRVGFAGPFEVPIGVLIPQKIDGLLVAEKNISTSRLANGAVRVQPIAMGTGQAAGALAALAAHNDQRPRDVDVVNVQKVLVESGVVIHANP